MVGAVLTYNKVIVSVIASISVNMMHLLRENEAPSQHPFNDTDMLIAVCYLNIRRHASAVSTRHVSRSFREEG